MRSISEYLPWGLLVASLCIIGADSIEAERLEFAPDDDLCRLHSETARGTRLQLRIHNQHLIWVSCSNPKDA